MELDSLDKPMCPQLLTRVLAKQCSIVVDNVWGNSNRLFRGKTERDKLQMVNTKKQIIS